MEPELKYPIPDKQQADLLSAAIGCHPVVAGILLTRGIKTPEQAEHFLNPGFEDLANPFALKDMDLACKRIYKAVTQGEKILVFGDFDADGVTATAMLYEFLTLVDADVSWYVPHRSKEGYSLHRPHIEMAAEMDADLIITVDCGITSADAVDAAAKEDIDVIVTDHHEPGEELPQAFAIVNPKQPGCTSGLTFLAGVGVAFFLIMALRKVFRDKGVWETFLEPDLLRFLDLFALGTIGDMVPLINENRVFCLSGLALIQKGRRPGLKALAQASRLDLSQLDSDDISFRLIPRINAAGRISHARICVSLLTSPSIADARPTAALLDDLNLRRQQIERAITAQIETRIALDPRILESRAMTLFDPDWNASVLGIAASRLSRKYNRPVVLLTEKEDLATGSCRSINQINIHEALQANEDLLEKFGGHAMAAGLTLKPKNIEPLMSAMDAYLSDHYTEEDFRKRLTYDAELRLEEITLDLALELNRLKPFGTANPEPVFLARNVWVDSSVIIGNSHRKMVLRTENPKILVEAMQFNLADTSELPAFFSKIRFRIKVNRFKSETVQLILEDL